ncbi:MAG TPA: hypothetical protein VK928_00485 [Longimicrobiales bacterium]|nr:hypothetical protein [Longimicrobiales bacterium]
MTPLAIIVSTFFGCLIGAFVPVINTELLLLSMSAVAPPGLVVPIIVVAAIGQMIGKSVLYAAARGALALPAGRFSQHVNEAARRIGNRKAISGVLLFASASSGLPPFYFMSIAAGLMRVHFGHFLVIGTSGRLLRFAAIVLFPQVIKTFF